MYIPQISNITEDYFHFNREERNYAAIFYTALLIPGNIEKFLYLCRFNYFIDKHFGIYFEYSYLRDLWYKIKDNEIKKNIIKKKLNITNIDKIVKLPYKKFNEYFGVASTPSEDHIQYPGKWSISKYYDNFKNNPNDFFKICKFKWSFNIKPDIVIQCNKNQVVCIEAKYESGEGLYPSAENESKIFYDFRLPKVTQTNLQYYMFKELLGFKSFSIFLVYKKISGMAYRNFTWAETFNSMDISSLPLFAKEMIKKISNEN